MQTSVYSYMHISLILLVEQHPPIELLKPFAMLLWEDMQKKKYRAFKAANRLTSTSMSYPVIELGS